MITDITWVERAFPTATSRTSISYGNGVYVAASGSNVITSTDGITWSSPINLPAGYYWDNVVFCGSLFIAICTGGGSVATSSNGTTWSLRALPFTAAWKTVCFGNGVYVAICAYVTPSATSDRIATSTDGITWTNRALPISVNWRSICFGNGLFVAVAYNSSNAATSTDGITWTQRTLPVVNNWTSVTYGNGLFVALAYSSLISATSPDGITWTQRDLPVSAQWVSITYGDGLFVTVSYGTVSITSPDGINWTQKTLPVNISWCSVVFGNAIFLALASGNITAYAAGAQSVPTTPTPTSTPLVTNIPTPSPTGTPNNNDYLTPISGSFIVNNNRGNISITINNDLLSDGVKHIVANVFRQNILLGSSLPVTINDTSTNTQTPTVSPTPSITLTPTPSQTSTVTTTPTPTVTSTPTPSATSTPTVTATPSATSTPTPTLETQAPTAPVLTATLPVDVNQSDDRIILAWTASTDNVGVVGYKVYRNNVFVYAVANVLTYTDTGLTQNTTYTHTVTAIDAAGNESVKSNATSKKTTLTQYAPYVNIAAYLNYWDNTNTAIILGFSILAEPWPTTSQWVFSWKRNGVQFSTSSTALYTLTSQDYGATISVTVTATNSLGTVSSTASIVPVHAVVPGYAPIFYSQFTINGDQATGAVPPSISVGGDPAPTLTYAWTKDGVAFSTAAQINYTLADVGHNFSLTITATNTHGSVTSTASAVPTEYTQVPSIGDSEFGIGVVKVDQYAYAHIQTYSSGKPAVGDYIHITPPYQVSGYPTPLPENTLYQWKRDGVAVSGVTSVDYPLTAADIGHSNITCTITATNKVGSAVVTRTQSITGITPQWIAPYVITPPTASYNTATGNITLTSMGTWGGYPISNSFSVAAHGEVFLNGGGLGWPQTDYAVSADVWIYIQGSNQNHINETTLTTGYPVSISVIMTNVAGAGTWTSPTYP